MANDDMGIKSIHLDEMIQACMVMPMQAKPLPWNSKELADLTAYVTQIQKTFKPKH
jgi:cytochrome c